MSHPSPSNGKSICYYSNQVVLASNHVKHYMNLLKIENINKSSEMFIEFAVQKKKIRLSFDTAGSISETESQAIEMARMYLMHRIMYWKALN